MGESNQKTILLVEDEVILAMSGKTQLEKYGYKDVTANSGEKAVDTFKAGPAGIDLVLMDINPGNGLDGTEAARATAILKATIVSPKDLVIMAIDRDYRYLIFNATHGEAMRVAYGTVPAIGASALECITSPDDRVKAKENYDKAMRGESHSTLEEYGDLEKTYFESHYDPIIGGQGEVIGITAFARDITERKQVQERLSKATERLE